jgi:Putative zinc-finger
MTGSTLLKEPMRHIPEEELHAYLDQGLSRSQCVEIESHLAGCPACQSARDSIAALRDRTTALLAKLAPPRGFPPAFESLQRRADREASVRRRRIQVGAWVASLVAAVGLGWTAHYLTTPAPGELISARRIAPSAAAAPSVTPAALRSAPRSAPVRKPAVRRRASKAPAEAMPVVPPPVVAPPSLELSSIDIPRTESDLELDGMWRTLSWDGAQAAAGDKVPHIDGLPVVGVQLQASEQGKQPLMVVAQQLASGEVIRTIEGPTNDVSHLLARRTMTDPDPAAAADDSSRSRKKGPPTDRTMAMQRGDRLLVITGALPPDSLLAMIRRLNAEMRSK